MEETKHFQHLVLADRSLQKYQDDYRRTRDFISTYDYRKKHNSIRNIRYDGTCAWFLESEEVLSWLNTGESLFCCFGIPGSGKTIIASAMIDAVVEKTLTSHENLPAIVCYHYCDYADGVTLDATNIIANLTRQLLDLYPSCINSIIKRCHEMVDTGFSISFPYAAFCLEEVLKTSGPLLIVIDGVDEMDAINQDILFNQIHHLLKQYSNTLKILLFGRHDERMVRCHLQNAKSITISKEDNMEDLVNYIESRLQACIDSGDLVLRDESFAHTIAEKLLIGAEHMLVSAYRLCNKRLNDEL
jgi:DNA replication protein DnaC